jgi:hypothetical protein
MNKTLLLIIIITLLSCSKKSEIEINDLVKIQQMDMTRAEEYLTELGWKIDKVKQESPNASIIDYWDISKNNIKTVKVGSGKVNEILFTKFNSKDSTNLLLSFRELEYNKMGQGHKKDEFLNNGKVIRIISATNLYSNEISGKSYNLINNRVTENVYEKIYQKDSTIFWLTTIVNKPASSELTEMRSDYNTYELIITDINFYKNAVEKRKHEIEFQKRRMEMYKRK